MGLMMRLLLLLCCAVSLWAATVPQSPLALTIAAPDVPAGGVAQVRITLVQPRQMASGAIVMDFDPAVFGPVTAVDVFSANGDQIGVANLRDRHIEAQFSSLSGGIGRLPGMPAITVNTSSHRLLKRMVYCTCRFGSRSPFNPALPCRSSSRRGQRAVRMV